MDRDQKILAGRATLNKYRNAKLPSSSVWKSEDPATVKPSSGDTDISASGPLFKSPPQEPQQQVLPSSVPSTRNSQSSSTNGQTSSQNNNRKSITFADETTTKKQDDVFHLYEQCKQDLNTERLLRVKLEEEVIQQTAVLNDSIEKILQERDLYEKMYQQEKLAKDDLLRTRKDSLDAFSELEKEIRILKMTNTQREEENDHLRKELTVLQKQGQHQSQEKEKWRQEQETLRREMEEEKKRRERKEKEENDVTRRELQTYQVQMEDLGRLNKQLSQKIEELTKENQGIRARAMSSRPIVTSSSEAMDKIVKEMVDQNIRFQEQIGQVMLELRFLRENQGTLSQGKEILDHVQILVQLVKNFEYKKAIFHETETSREEKRKKSVGVEASIPSRNNVAVSSVGVTQMKKSVGVEASMKSTDQPVVSDTLNFSQKQQPKTTSTAVEASFSTSSPSSSSFYSIKETELTAREHAIKTEEIHLRNLEKELIQINERMKQERHPKEAREEEALKKKPKLPKQEGSAKPKQKQKHTFAWVNELSPETRKMVTELFHKK